MVAGMPIKMSAFPDAERRPAAPALDGDRDRILADFP
jgi:CoA:oxalate CoA-transferase